MRVVYTFLGLVWLILACPWSRQCPPLEASSSISTGSGLGNLSRLDRYGKMPLDFEVNQGQTDAQVRFLAHARNYTVYLTPKEAVLVVPRQSKFTPGVMHSELPALNLGPIRFALLELKKSSRELGARLPVNSRDNFLRNWGGLADRAEPSVVVRMKLVGANPQPTINGLDPLSDKTNYFIGNDRTKWVTGVPTFTRVKYADVYPGIDLLYHGSQKEMEYDFVVAPGVDPSRVQFELREVSNTSVDEGGDLVLQLNEGELRWRKPIVYQESNGKKRLIPARYIVRDGQRFGFEIGEYDVSKTLVIDPSLIYGTFLGNSGFSEGEAIAVDRDGNACLTGVTSSTEFPTEIPFQSQNNATGGNLTAFVTKVNATGSGLIYSTYLGGTGTGTGGLGIALDSDGNAYVTGVSGSADFPTTPGAFQTAFPSPTGASAFVTKFDPSGRLIYSTYLGGSHGATGFAIAVDLSGDAYVTGATQSTDFPTTPGAVQTSLRARLLEPNVFDTNAFVTKLTASGGAVSYSTYLGGSVDELGSGIAVDRFGNAYVSGVTDSADFPTSPGAFQTTSISDTPVTNRKGFVAKLNALGTAFVYSTYLGGSKYLFAPFNAVSGDIASGISLDRGGHAYVTGLAGTLDFPTTPGAYQTTKVPGDALAFVAKLGIDGSDLVYSTYLTDAGNGNSPSIAVDRSGNAYVTGPSPANCASVSKLNRAGSTLADHICLGPIGGTSKAIALDPRRNVYVTGWTSSMNFPTTLGAFQTELRGDDAFVVKIILQNKPTPSEGDCTDDDDQDDFE